MIVVNVLRLIRKDCINKLRFVPNFRFFASANNQIRR